MSRMRVAVVGVGHLGKFHARVFSQMNDVELVGVVDSRVEQAEQIAGDYGTTPYTDYRELFDKVDAVSIAVPTRFHRQVAGEFLERGIPTMIEKPLASTAAEAEELVALAEKHGLTMQVGHIERFNPALGSLDGMPMRPKYIAAERLGTYTFRSTDIGVVLDLMIHDIDLILSMVHAPVVSVAAVGVSVFGGHEDIANARIQFADGCVANLTASRASYQAVRKMRIWSSEGYATLDFQTKHGTLIRPSDALRMGEIDLAGVDLTKQAAVKERIFSNKVLRVDQVQTEGRDALEQELEDFVSSVKSGGRPRVSGVDGLRAVALAEQVLASLNSHHWEGGETGPMGPLDLPVPGVEPIVGLTGPKSWKYKGVKADASVGNE